MHYSMPFKNRKCTSDTWMMYLFNWNKRSVGFQTLNASSALQSGVTIRLSMMLDKLSKCHTLDVVREFKCIVYSMSVG